MLARGGHSQAETAAIVGCSKRDVSECASWLRKSGTMLEQLEAMSEAEAAASGGGDDGHLQVEAKSLVERKSRTRACCSSSCGPSAARRGAGRLPFSYSRICEILSEGAGRSGASSTSQARRPTSTGRATSRGPPTGSRAGGPRRTCQPSARRGRDGYGLAGARTCQRGAGWTGICGSSGANCVGDPSFAPEYRVPAGVHVCLVKPRLRFSSRCEVVESLRQKGPRSSESPTVVTPLS